MDLISRQAAIEYFMINTNWHDEEGHSIDDWDEKRKLLEDYFNGVPSAQPERETGKWVPVTNGRGGNECSQCHSYAPAYQDGDEFLSNYCPYCGADMRGGQDG